MNDVNHSSNGQKTKHNRSLMKKENMSAENLPMFSSPQNRRMSSQRKLQSLKSPTNSDTRDSGRRDVGGGGRASSISVGGGVNGQSDGSVPREAVLDVSPGAIGVPVNASTAGAVGRGNDDSSFFDLLKTSDTSTRGSIEAQSNRSKRRGTDPIQEVLGSSPILLVDDAVSILKMTKRAIHNECPNIRSRHFYQHFNFSTLVLTLSHALTTRYQLY